MNLDLSDIIIQSYDMCMVLEETCVALSKALSDRHNIASEGDAIDQDRDNPSRWLKIPLNSFKN